MSIAPHVVVMGVSGAGKTTVATLLAELLDRPFAEADDMHPVANVRKMAAGTPLTDDDRWPWLRRVRDWLSAEGAAARSAVITCSALRRAYRDLLREAVGGVVFVHLEGDPALIADRLRHRRGHFMPADLLDSQLETLELLAPDENGLVVHVRGSAEETALEARRQYAALTSLNSSPRSTGMSRSRP